MGACSIHWEHPLGAHLLGKKEEHLVRISRKHCLVLRGWKDLIATASKYVRTMVFEKFKLNLSLILGDIICIKVEKFYARDSVFKSIENHATKSN